MTPIDAKYRFPINSDGSIGPGKEISLTNHELVDDEIIVRIAPLISGSYIARHRRWHSLWEIDLDRSCIGNGIEFFRWDSERDCRPLSMDDFFAWLLETYPADYSFVMFNLEFFENRFTLVNND